MQLLIKRQLVMKEIMGYSSNAYSKIRKILNQISKN